MRTIKLLIFSNALFPEFARCARARLPTPSCAASHFLTNQKPLTRALTYGARKNTVDRGVRGTKCVLSGCFEWYLLENSIETQSIRYDAIALISPVLSVSAFGKHAIFLHVFSRNRTNIVCRKCRSFCGTVQ